MLGAVFPLPTRDLLPWHVLTIALALAAGTLTGGRVIASGELSKAVVLKGIKATKGAKAAIEAAGGKVEE